jgi:O-antigen ligase/polysaccharide polymerase Wzy-like membrane protein
VAIGDNGNNSNVATTEAPIRRMSVKMADPTKSAFFWLACFFVVYCTRFQDFIPGLPPYLPFAKVPIFMAIWGLFSAMGKTKRTFKDMPKMVNLLLYMIILLYIGAFLSPIWKGGALTRTADFSKIYVCWVLVFLIITTFDRLKRIIFIQAFSVVLVCIAVIIKGHDVPRLDNVLGGFYSNPNDLAFAVVLSLPYALAFFVAARNAMVKAFWCVGMLLMLTVIFLTASRAGFIDLCCSYSAALYFIAIKGKRYWLIVASALIGIVIVSTVGGRLYERFSAMSGGSTTEQSAYGSYEDRKYLMVRAVEGIEHYPLFGLGCRNFETYSLIWHEVHMTYLQIAVEGGVPVLILYLMFFRRDFQNIGELQRMKDLPPDVRLFAGALIGTQVGFIVGALFAPEAYQFYPYFATAFTATLLQTMKEQQKEGGSAPPPPKKPRHFLEVYADRNTTGAVSPVR